MMAGEFQPTDSQAKAINELDGRLFIAAGAGSGKTAVVARRFIEAVASGRAEVDQILTITFTKKAAAEMMDRVRKVLRQQIKADRDPGRAERLRQAYRNIERARISTMDSFYSRVLKANALAAGIDPDFAPVDEPLSLLLKEEAFDVCLKDFVRRHDKAGADLVMAYDRKLTGKLFAIINDVYSTFRSRGWELRLPEPNPEKLVDQNRKRLQAAINGFDEAVKLTGVEGKTVDNLRESNLSLRGAIKAPDLENRERLLLAGRPKRGLKKLLVVYDELKAAWEAYLLAIKSQKAAGTIGLMSDLLASYDQAYSDLKYRKGVLDFADLSLKTRDLLLNNENIKKRLASSFSLIMVDEFQDTNPLQLQIAELIADDNLMMVGDENQSIFGFRDAEVALFQAEKKRADLDGYSIRLLDNFRSQPEILAFVDGLFRGDDMLASGYLELVPRAEIDPQKEDHRVELIMVDQQPPGREKKLPADEARLVEAQLIAEKLCELFGQGYSSGDVAILVRARTGIETYRDALDRLEIRNYLAIGVSYFERLALADIISMYQLMVNPLDDEALVAVLRSPLVGASDDTLYWLRQAAGQDSHYLPRPLWPVIRTGQAMKRFTEDDRGRLQRFAAELAELREYAGRHSLQQTARRLIFHNDYAATVTAGYQGKQALANLMKLIDLAADYESVWGRDLVAFTEFLSHQKSVQARESDAPIEEEGVSAVRIMTIHTAKGLEFPLVVLPKLGAEKGHGNNKPVIIVDRDEASGRVGLEYRDSGSAKDPVFDYDELAGEEKLREIEEEKRLHYVAMTRAKRHLVLVGYGQLDEPAKIGEDARPLDWIRTRLSLDRESRPGLDQLEEIDEITGAKVGLQVCTDADDVLFRAEKSAAAHELSEGYDNISPSVNDLPGPPKYVPPVISPTALDAYQACPRRYYLQNVLNAAALFELQGRSRAAAEGCVLNPTQMGSLIHKVLESDLRGAVDGSLAPGYLENMTRQLFGSEASLADTDHERATALLATFAKSSVARDLAAALEVGGLYRELEFSTLVGQTIVGGFIDALCPMPANHGTLVVDYKTGKTGEGRTPEEAAQTYRLQMACYALAASRLRPGPVKVVLAYLGGDDPVEVRHEFSAADIAALENEIQSVIDSMADGEFPPLAEFDLHQCPWCVGGPNGARLCVHADQAASV
ncbi:MAG: UvrD-helicase domain-containing protein [Thermoleophilia bacterium]